jgi:hypothetical protein
MREIQMSQGLIALVDDEDYERINHSKWWPRKDGNAIYARSMYRTGTVRKFHKMHNLILHCPKGMQTDHIDGNGLNNQKANLRIVNHRENQQNQHVSKTSKYPGVCYDKRTKKFISGIKINGVRKNLGSFTNEFAAFQTYVVATVVLVNGAA